MNETTAHKVVGKDIEAKTQFEKPLAEYSLLEKPDADGASHWWLLVTQDVCAVPAMVTERMVEERVRTRRETAYWTELVCAGVGAAISATSLALIATDSCPRREGPDANLWPKCQEFVVTTGLGAVPFLGCGIPWLIGEIKLETPVVQESIQDQVYQTQLRQPCTRVHELPSALNLQIDGSPRRVKRIRGGYYSLGPLNSAEPSVLVWDGKEWKSAPIR